MGAGTMTIFTRSTAQRVAAALLPLALLLGSAANAADYDYSDPFKQPRLNLPDLGGADTQPQEDNLPPAPASPDFSFPEPASTPVAAPPEAPTAPPAMPAAPANNGGEVNDNWPATQPEPPVTPARQSDVVTPPPPAINSGSSDFQFDYPQAVPTAPVPAPAAVQPEPPAAPAPQQITPLTRTAPGNPMPTQAPASAPVTVSQPEPPRQATPATLPPLDQPPATGATTAPPNQTKPAFIFTPVQRQTRSLPDGSSPRAPIASTALRGEFTQQAATYLAMTGSPMLAAAQLLSADQLGWLDLNKPVPGRLLTQWLQQAGMYKQAARRAQTAQSGWSSFARNEYWLHQASIWLHRDYPSNAETALQRVHAPKHSPNHNHLNGLMTRALLYQHRFAGAAQQLEALKGRPQSSIYQQYNLAIAWLGMGKTQQGLGLLFQLGQIAAINPEIQGLRDRANLMLGWTLLKDKHAGNARVILGLVQKDGMDAARARLGMGWAELAPDGKQAEITILRPRMCLRDAAYLLRNANALRRIPDGDCHPENPQIFHHDQQLPFRAGGDKHSRYQHAIAAWKPLLDQPIAWAPVREALLASAQSWHVLGNSQQALATYKQAVKRLQQEQVAVKALVAKVNNPAIDPVALLNRPKYRHRLLHWRASREFVAALDDRDALRQSMEQLDLDSQRLQRLAANAMNADSRAAVASLQQRWQQTRESVQQAYTQLNLTLRERTTERLQAELNDLQKYLTRARLEYATVLTGGS